MVVKIDTAYVKIWGDTVGAVSWLKAGYAVFEYDRSFLRKGLDLAPINMPIVDALQGDGLYEFRSLNPETFKGLPGLLADCLPDKFGNKVIDVWLARHGRDVNNFHPVERLCYTGKRGMGALEFSPALNTPANESTPVEITHLVELAQAITSERSKLDATFGVDENENSETMMDIIRVGTSAGGARAKAVIAMDAKGNIRSGQTTVPPGYSYWLLKFDGVNDLELGVTQGYGRIEFAYYLMAQDAGLVMAECKLLEEGRRAHFMTRRFDRIAGEKVHMQSLCGIGHYDFNAAGAYGYEQAFAVMRKLKISKADALQQFRRMVFNVVSRNQDDHTKNIAFLMDKTGQWRLSPAYDVTYAHNPKGQWTNTHQMTVNGKRDNFTLEDFVAIGRSISLQKPEIIVEEIVDIVSKWPDYANKVGMDKGAIQTIGSCHRLLF